VLIIIIWSVDCRVVLLEKVTLFFNFVSRSAFILLAGAWYRDSVDPNRYALVVYCSGGNQSDDLKAYLLSIPRIFIHRYRSRRYGLKNQSCLCIRQWIYVTYWHLIKTVLNL